MRRVREALDPSFSEDSSEISDESFYAGAYALCTGLQFLRDLKTSHYFENNMKF